MLQNHTAKPMLALLLAAVLVFASLAGCQKDDPQPATTPAVTEETTPAPTTTAAPEETEDPGAGEFSSYYMPGDKMQDFTVKLSDGREMTLSQLLQTKELVILNFWATWCGPCQMEFPFMEEAYRKYQDQVEIIALSVEPTDTNDVIEAFKKSNNLTVLPMGQDITGLSGGFFFDAIPTSVAIDRFGVICWQESGSITSTDGFERLFSGFLGEDYTESKVGYVIPGPKPTVEHAEAGVLAGALNAPGGEIPVANDADPSVWPFLPTEGGALKSTNQGMDETKAVVHATVSAKAGEVLAFDYWMSSETAMDCLMLEVDGRLIDIFSGEEQGTYAYAFTADGDHAVTFTYQKNMAGSVGEDYALIDNLKVLIGGEATAALAALPSYPLTLEGTACQILPTTGKQILISEPSGMYAAQMGNMPSYVIGANEATFTIKLGKDLNPKMALIYEDFAGAAYAVSALPQTEDGFTLTLPLSSVEVGGYSSTYVYLYPNYMADPNEAVVLYIYVNEENLNYFVYEELANYYGLAGATWAYADGTAPSTDAIAKPQVEVEIPDGSARYVVKFVDQNGDPVANVMAQICDAQTCEVLPSDANGTVQYVKPAYAYEIHVLMAPEGYTFDMEAVYTMPPEGGEILIIGTRN